MEILQIKRNHAHLNNKNKLHLLFSILMFKGALSGLRQFLTNETFLKMMRNAFYFTLKTLFVRKIFKFLA